MAQPRRIPTEVIRETLSNAAAAAIINDELLRLPMYSEARMSTIARQPGWQEAAQEMRECIQQVYVYQ
jgi:hypothetical protein